MTSETVLHYKPPRTGPSKSDLEAAHAVIAIARAAAEERTRDTMLVCTTQCATGAGCGAMQKVRDTVFVQTHWYTSPHGCTGGDYWNAGEGEFLCAACGHRNRLYQSPEVTAMKPYFKSVEDTYDR